MKKNMFGESILQPGDDVGVAFSEAFDTDISAVLTARFIEHDEKCGWTCQIEDEECNEIQVHDFPTEEALREYLKNARVQIDG